VRLVNGGVTCIKERNLVIYCKTEFNNFCIGKPVKLGALPQSNEKWCLALKNNDGVVYLGNESGQKAIEFSTVD
jgi:hypothetical protein